MKKLLVLFLLMMPESEKINQTVLFNTGNQMLYIIQYNDTLSYFTINPLKEAVEIPVSCLGNKVTSLNQINFTNSPACLMTSLNQAFKLNITSYIDLNNSIDMKELKEISKTRKLNDLLYLYQNAATSYSLIDFYQLYRNYQKLDKFTYQTNYPILFKLDKTYLPITSFIAK